MLIDTHTHILKEDNVEEYISNAKNNGIDIMILGGTSKEENEFSIELINKYNELYMTIGFHPEFCNDIKESDYQDLINTIKNNKKIVGIGEIGLDYHYGKEDRIKQIELFERQLSIAEEYNLPVVIHTRDAMKETYNILKKYKVKGIMHCYSGSYEMAKKFIDLGFYLGIGGVVTFKNSKLKDVVEKIDMNNIVFETDSPYLSPFRGEKNESANIKYICEFVANLKNISAVEVEKITTSNASSIFDFNRNL